MILLMILDQRTRIWLSVISHKMNSSYSSMFQIARLISKQIWREGQRKMLSYSLLLGRKSLFSIRSPSAEKIRPRSQSQLVQKRKKRCRSSQKGNWGALLPKEILGNVRKEEQGNGLPDTVPQPSLHTTSDPFLYKVNEAKLTDRLCAGLSL